MRVAYQVSASSSMKLSCCARLDIVGRETDARNVMRQVYEEKIDYNAARRPPNLVEVQEKRTPFREYFITEKVGVMQERMNRDEKSLTTSLSLASAHAVTCYPACPEYRALRSGLCRVWWHLSLH